MVSMPQRVGSHVHRWSAALADRPGLLVPALAVLSLLLRLPALGSRPVWYDEAFSVLLAARPLGDILAGTAADTMPPAYYLALRLWMSAGQAIGFLRALNVMLGVLLVGLTYVMARACYDARSAAWAALLCAVSPLLIYHAQELRMYTLLALALGVYAYLVFRLMVAPVGRQAWGWWAGLIAAGALALYTHNLAVFSLVAPNIYLAIRRAWRDLGRLVLAQLAMVLAFLPWLVVVPGQVAKIQAAFWTPRPGALEIVQAIVSFHAALPLPAAWIPAGVTAAVLAVVGTLYVVLRHGRGQTATGYLLALVLIPPGLLLLASYVMRPLFVPRACLLSLVAYLILAGWVIATARPRLLAWTVAAAFAIAAAVGLPAQFAHDTFPRSPFDAAATYLRTTEQPGDVVVHDNKLSFFPMHLYAPGLHQVFLPDEPGSHNDTLAAPTQRALGLLPVDGVEEAAGGARRVRYVVFARALDEYSLRPEGEPAALTWLRAHAVPGEAGKFNDLWVYDFSLAP
jgi:uncharacterized membrane protein